MDGLAFLDKPAKSGPQPVYALTGDEDFLKRQVVQRLQEQLLGDADPAFSVSTYPGDQVAWPAVRNELDTLPFLSPRRVVVIEPADPFVTAYRADLEKYLADPAGRGVLVLVVRTWPKTTRLAKLLPDEATIDCKAPPAARLPGWCVAWAKKRHGKAIQQSAAELLVELVGPQMGLLDQELAKLAAFVGEAKAITEEDVERIAGRSWVADVFKIFDAIGHGRTAEALAILDRLFEQNKEPLEVLGAFSWKLRQLAQVSRLHGQGQSLAAALERAGVPPFARRGIEAQLRHLGRRRLEMLYDWLIESDLGMKGNSQLPPRVLLERLIVRLARPRVENQTGSVR
jgi:DNA polymerase-3 subunit delta